MVAFDALESRVTPNLQNYIYFIYRTSSELFSDNSPYKKVHFTFVDKFMFGLFPPSYPTWIVTVPPKRKPSSDPQSHFHEQKTNLNPPVWIQVRDVVDSFLKGLERSEMVSYELPPSLPPSPLYTPRSLLGIR